MASKTRLLFSTQVVGVVLGLFGGIGMLVTGIEGREWKLIIAGAALLLSLLIRATDPLSSWLSHRRARHAGPSDDRN